MGVGKAWRGGFGCGGSGEIMSQISDIRARYNANGNAVIPNTFQHPNIFVDKLMYYLTPEENVVLTFAVRRILGFQQNIMSRKDNISLSQFADSIVSEEGVILSRGCGIGVNTIRNCLENLEKYKILLPASEKPNPIKGQEYWLQDNENAIDWQGLEARKEERKIKYATQVQKATQKSLKVRGIVERKGNVERNTPVTSDDRLGVTSDVNTKPIETQRNPPSDFSPAKQEPDKLAEWLKMGHFAGAKRETRIDAILSYLGERFHVNTEVKKWKDFAKFVETRQTHHGESVEVFVSWLLGQKDFNLQYWPPSKMQEFWPMAFVKNGKVSQPVQVDADGFPESY